MEYSVIGRTIYPGYTLPIFIDDEGQLSSCPDRYRSVVFTAGSVFLDVDGQKLFVEAPGILCLNGSEKIEILKSDSLSFRQVYFLPRIINVNLTPQIVLDRDAHGPAQPYHQDLYWLDPFCGFADRYIKLGPNTLSHCASLLDSLKKSLDEQVDMFWPCRSRSYFLEFLFFARNLVGEYDVCQPSGAGDSIDTEKFDAILLYMHSNFHEDLSLSDMCDRFAINRTSLNELFQKNVGQSIIQYLIALRIRFACLLLRDTTLPVKEVVARSGFNDIINFTRTFKRRTSYTPARYRQEFCYMITC